MQVLYQMSSLAAKVVPNNLWGQDIADYWFVKHKAYCLEDRTAFCCCTSLVGVQDGPCMQTASVPNALCMRFDRTDNADASPQARQWMCIMSVKNQVQKRHGVLANSLYHNKLHVLCSKCRTCLTDTTASSCVQSLHSLPDIPWY